MRKRREREREEKCERMLNSDALYRRKKMNKGK